MKNLSQYIKNDETLVAAYRQRPITYIWGWLFGVLLLCAAAFFIWPAFHYGQWGVAGWVVLVLVGVILCVRTTRLWSGNLLLLTDKGLVDVYRAGFFREFVSQLSYSDIQDVSWSRPGWCAALLRYGSVQVLGAAGTVNLVFYKMPKPKSIAERLTNLRDQARGVSRSARS